jgi:hypothetical protein
MKSRPIPKETLRQIDERSGGRCEYTQCQRPQGDFRGLQNAHIIHRGLGGRHGEMETIINDSRNIAKLCAVEHDIIDRRRLVSEGERQSILEAIKEKIGWYAWARENDFAE